MDAMKTYLTSCDGSATTSLATNNEGSQAMAIRKVTEERIRTTLIISKKLHAKLNKICDKKNISMAQYIREIIERSIA
jgi:predicted HicB family RNase H-like nuclease